MPNDEMGQSPSPAINAAQDRFVLEWGRMSSSWGINRTMAQIHALLLVTGDAHTVDQMIERLHISRGNASMNLRDLMDWGLVERTRLPGDRKDTYECNSDILTMFARVVRERKRREIDPTIAAIRDCLAMVPEEDRSEEAAILRERLNVLLELFAVVDKIYQKIFESDASVRETLRFYVGEREESENG
ncbi:MAG: MarR family transcriptional regulator [Fimbriimonadaceae bacterium]|nr:MarR family transcriptional regulator [Fimbriimonadaceae bacterium]